MKPLQLSLCVVFLLFLQQSTTAQKIRGVVIDSKTGEVLKYVNIGVFNKNMGVISRDDGKFDIDISKAAPEDHLSFSMLGYETSNFKIADLGTEDLTVKLTPRVYQLKEVVVTDEKRIPVKLGRSKPTKTTTGHSNTEQYGFGGEWGLKISNEGKRYWIENAAFHLRFNTVDSVLFRIRLYSVKDDLPHEDLLRHDVFVTSYKNNRWITKDLSSENLIMDEDIIVTLEVVRVWPGKSGEQRLFFTHGAGYEQGKTYSRASSFDRWAVNERPPLTMVFSVVEYD
jgi:hypothetical protein